MVVCGLYAESGATPLVGICKKKSESSLLQRLSEKLRKRYGVLTCTSANVISCITCTYCNKLYISETGRRLGYRFREHLRDVERNDKDAYKPVARHSNLPKQHVAVCGLSLHLGGSEIRKTLEQKLIFQIGILNPHGINESFSFNIQLIYFCFLVNIFPPMA